MRLDDPPRRRSEASLLPMINVIFLLLVFFLISAQMTPPEPFAVAPPEVASPGAEVASGRLVLHLDAGGTPGFGAETGPAALAALAAARAGLCAGQDCTADPPRLDLRADAAMPADRLAALLPQLAAMGFGGADLVVRAGGAGR